MSTISHVTLCSYVSYQRVRRAPTVSTVPRPAARHVSEGQTPAVPAMAPAFRDVSLATCPLNVTQVK